MGKGTKIATVNLNMGTYNSGKFKGVKPYTVNQNVAKVTSLFGRVKQTWAPPSVNDVSIPKSTIEVEIHPFEP